LRNSNTAGSPDLTVNFGQQGDLPVAGDWNGDGGTDIGVYRGNTFLLAVLKLTVTRPCFVCAPIVTATTDPLPAFTFGQVGDLPIAGDWDGDGKHDVGVFRNGEFFLRQPITPLSVISPIFITINFSFGQAGDKPLAGDWNGDGVDTVGFFRAIGGRFFLRNSNTAGNPDISILNLGDVGDHPVAGDWNGDGKDTIGIFRNGQFQLSNSAVSSSDGAADIVFSFGQAGDLPVAGDWNGLNIPPISGVNDPASGSSRSGHTQVFTTTCSDADGWRNISTIDFKVSKSDGAGAGVPVALWVQFDQNANLIRFYNPDSQTWSEGKPGSNVVLSSRFADLYLAGTHVQGSGPTGPSVQITWEVVFKDGAVMNNYKQYLKITDDFGASTGFDKVGAWSVAR
jgi:hypothetical protein